AAITAAAATANKGMKRMIRFLGRCESDDARLVQGDEVTPAPVRMRCRTPPKCPIAPHGGALRALFWGPAGGKTETALATVFGRRKYGWRTRTSLDPLIKRLMLS